jgi:hypothetical protein
MREFQRVIIVVVFVQVNRKYGYLLRTVVDCIHKRSFAGDRRENIFFIKLLIFMCTTNNLSGSFNRKLRKLNSYQQNNNNNKHSELLSNELSKALLILSSLIIFPKKTKRK